MLPRATWAHGGTKPSARYQRVGL